MIGRVFNKTAVATLLGIAVFVVSTFIAFAQTPQINYQGKITDNTGLAVADGDYDVTFALYTVASGGSAVWTEARTGGNQVTVTNGLFSVMLGEVATLSGVDFTDTLYLGVNFDSDGEMTPRKLLGTVPAAFEAQNAQTLDNIATSSFLRSDQADTASGLLTFSGGLVSSASSTITELTTGTSTITTLVIDGETFTDLTGSGLQNSAGVLTVNTDDFAGSFATTTDFDTSAELAAILTDETGSGAAVFNDSPSFVGAIDVTTSGSDSSIDLTRSGGASLRFSAGTGNATLGTLSNDLIYLLTNSTVRMTIREDGAVGIGDTTPSGLFSVGAASQFSVNNSGVVTAGTWQGSAIGSVYGGTGLTSYATGDLIYASGANTLAKRGIGTAGQVLQVNGGVPTWVATSSLGIDSSITADSLDFTDFADAMTIDANTSVDTFTNGYIQFDGGTALARFGGAITLTDAGFTLDGTNGLSLLNGVVEVPNGSAGTPTFTFESDTNTGMYRAAADELGFSTNGSERMRIDASGNVEVSSSNASLTVNGALQVANSSTNVLVGHMNTNGGSFNAAVGITNQVSGSGSSAFGYNNDALNTNSSAFGYTNVVSAANASAFGSNITNNMANSTQIGPSNSAKLTILSSGSVGIGTTTPTERLTVAGGGLFEDTVFLAPGALGTSGISFVGDTNTGVYSDVDNVVRIGSNGTPATYFNEFLVGFFEDKVEIDSTGKIKASGSLTATNPAYSFVTDTDTGMYRSAANELSFSTGGTQRLRISSSGTVFATGDIESGLVQIDNGGSIYLDSYARIDAGYSYISAGNFSLGTTSTPYQLTVDGDTYLTGSLIDSTHSSGTPGMVLQTTGAGTQWVATSSLGIGGSIAADSLDFTEFADSMTLDAATSINVLSNDLTLDGGSATATFGDEIVLSDSNFALSRNGLVMFDGDIDVDSNEIGYIGTFRNDGNSTNRQGLLVQAGLDNLATAGLSTLLQFNDGDGTSVGNIGFGGGDMLIDAGLNGLDIDATGTLNITTGSGMSLSSANWNIDGFANLLGGTLATVANNSGYALYVLNDGNNLNRGGVQIQAGLDNPDTAALSKLIDFNDGDGGGLGYVGFGRDVDYWGTPALKIDATSTANTLALGTDSSFVTLGNTVAGVAINSYGLYINATEGEVLISNFAISELDGTTIGDNLNLNGTLTDGNASTGTNGMVLQTTGTGVQWVATSSLGISGGASLFTDGGANTYLTDTSDNLSIGGTGGSSKLNVYGDINIAQANAGLSFIGTRYFYASSSNDSIAIGEGAGEDFTNGTTYNVALGYEAGQNASNAGADYNLYLGYRAGESNSGNNNNIFGEYAGETNTGDHNNMMGFWSGRLSTGNGNNFFGNGAGYDNAGDENNLIGLDAGVYNIADYVNSIGSSAGYNNTGSYSNLIGSDAGYYNSANNVNLFGFQAGYRNAGGGNTSIGYQAGYYLGGSDNIAIGTSALAGVATNTAANNVVLGYRAGYVAGSGANNNILIGFAAADNLTTGNNNIVIGSDIDNITATADNTLNIGNLLFGTGIDGTGTTLSSGNIGIGTSTPTHKLTVAGNASFTGTSNFVDADITGRLDLGSDSYINNVGFVRLVSGNEGGPAFSFNNDADTGMWNAQANTLAFSTGGTQRMEIDAAGNVGIGTTTPGRRLVVSSPGSGVMQVDSTGGLHSVSQYSTAGVSQGYVGYINSGSNGMGFLNDTGSIANLLVTNDGKVGIGTTTPTSLLSLERSTFSGAGTAGLSEFITTTNSVAAAVQYGNTFELDANNTATTTIVGKLVRVEDDTTFGNTVRGLEVQTNRGANTQGENTALSGTARTFGVRGITEGDAGGSFEPAGGFFQTRGTTQGNAIRGYSGSITSATLMSLFQDTSDFTGTGLELNFGNSGGSFADSSYFADFRNTNTSVFTVSARGTTTIGDGSNMASLQIGFGGLCVDNDGSCVASTTGQIASVSSYTGNSDLAEMYFSSQTLETGEVVTLAGDLSVRRASADADEPIIGVVSTKPGLLLGFDDQSTRAGESGYPVALKGRVPIKLSTENGPIKKGDSLMLSSIPGVAMKATSTATGTVIGIALEDFNESRMYSRTFINQFGDDMVDPVYQPVTDPNDPRVHDGCYHGGGGDLDAPCVPLDGESIIEQINSANQYLEEASVADQLAALSGTPSQSRVVKGKTVSVGQIIMFVDLRERFLSPEHATKLAALLEQPLEMDENETETETILDRLMMLANNFIDGVLTLTGLKVDRVEVTEELCVDDVCLDADDLRNLLEQSNGDTSSSRNQDDDRVVDSSSPDDSELEDQEDVEISPVEEADPPVIEENTEELQEEIEQPVATTTQPAPETNAADETEEVEVVQEVVTETIEPETTPQEETSTEVPEETEESVEVTEDETQEPIESNVTTNIEPS